MRAWRTWLLARRSADLLVLVGLVWLGAALVASLLLTLWDLGWWLGHGFEVVGILLVAAPVGARPESGGTVAVPSSVTFAAPISLRVRRRTWAPRCAR